VWRTDRRYGGGAIAVGFADGKGGEFVIRRVSGGHGKGNQVTQKVK